MISRAITRFIRISPRKTRLVADMVRGKSIDEARAILANLDKRARGYIEDTLKSAVGNAKKDPDISPGDLYISRITIDSGPMFKRYRAGSMGRAMMIKHRTSHISIELDLRKTAAAAKAEAKAGRPEKKPKVKKEATETMAKDKTKKAVAAKRGKK